jgi:hypothetical protein
VRDARAAGEGGRPERLWPSRLRWRFRGAALWPAFIVGTAIDAALLAELPPYDGAPDDLTPAFLVAGFANLFVVAVAAPIAGLVLRRRRRDLPRRIAADYAGAALVALLVAATAVAGVAHRPAVAAHRAAVGAAFMAVHDYVRASAPEFSPGLGHVDALQLSSTSYRACVPGPDPKRWLCLIVDTDQRPAGISRDESMEPNSALRTPGGFH